MTSFDMYLWVGIGCQRGVSQLAIGCAIESLFTQYDLDLATIAGIATLDRKANEPGLVDLCRESGWFLKTYSPERLNSVMVARSSQLVSTLVGTASVAEAAALCAAQTDILLVPKQKFQLSSTSGWVTVALAEPLMRENRTEQVKIYTNSLNYYYRSLPLPTSNEVQPTRSNLRFLS